MTPVLAPRICRDSRPWVKECRDCGHMKALSEFPIQGNPRANSYGGTQAVCRDCRREQLVAVGRPYRFKKQREVA